MQAIGFRKGNDNCWLIHRKRLVDPDCQLTDHDKTVDYLLSGAEVCVYLSYSRCRFECGIAEEGMESSELIDGVWCWPAGSEHYVEPQAVRFPDEFVEHAKSLDWIPTVVDEPELLAAFLARVVQEQCENLVQTTPG